MNDFYQRLIKAFTSSSNVLITCHRDPDLDAIGSCLAVHSALKRIGLNSVVWMADGVPKACRFFDETAIIQTTLPKEFDCLVVLDSSDIQRVSQYESLRLPERVTGRLSDEPIPVINIDHHQDNTQFGTFNIVEPVSSTGELLFGLFTDLHWPITPKVADFLYAAIVYDTGRFLHSNTTWKTFNIAGKLANSGAKIHWINHEMFENKSIDTFNIMKIGLDNLVVNRELGFAYTTLPKEVFGQEFKLIDVIRQLDSCHVFLVFNETPDGYVKISLRSRCEFNVAEFAAQFKGGGHVNAAGITIKGSLDYAKSFVLKALESALRHVPVQA